MEANAHNKRKWFVINLNQAHEECASVLHDKFEQTSASRFNISNDIIEIERTRGDCCGCCACFASLCSTGKERRFSGDLDGGVCGRPLIGAIAFSVVIVSVSLLVVLVWSLDGYGSNDDVGSGVMIDDLSGIVDM